MDFEAVPSLVLPDEQALRTALSDPDWMNLPHPGSWRVKSVWLCDLIVELKTQGKLPYNTEVQREAEQRLHLPRFNDSSSPLAILVYNAQGFAYNDELRAQGYVPLTQDLVEEAFRSGQEFETRSGKRLCVREIDGKRWVMEPRRRRYAVPVASQPVRVMDASRTKKKNKA